MDFKNNNPNDIFSSQWNQLELAVKEAKHNYHLFALSTIDRDSSDIRTVVLRNVNKKDHSISFHTDIRSPKFKQITKNPNVSVLFYDVQARTQIKMVGTASICGDEDMLKSLWERLS
jgi:Pyridoxamine-phosphate oxidase